MTNCPATTTKAAISFNGVPYPDPNYASAIYANSAANPAQDLDYSFLTRRQKSGQSGQQRHLHGGYQQ